MSKLEGGDGFKADALQGFDGGQFALFHPDAVAGSFTFYARRNAL